MSPVPINHMKQFIPLWRNGQVLEPVLRDENAILDTDATDVVVPF